MAFWSDFTDNGLEPKRKFTFMLSIGGESIEGGLPTSIEHYLIKKVKKPGFEITKTEHQFLNHTFYFPSRVKWKEVTFSVVDAISPNTTNRFLKILNESGYRLPKQVVDIGSKSQTMSKVNSAQALGIPRIHQINHEGNIVETWRLHGSWVSNCEFGELDYSAEDLMSIDVTLTYDFAECEFAIDEFNTGNLPASN